MVPMGTTSLPDRRRFDLRGLYILELRRCGVEDEGRNAGVDHRVQDERAEYVFGDSEIRVEDIGNHEREYERRNERDADAARGGYMLAQCEPALEHSDRDA